jgi:hypothetical protein
VIFTLVIKQLYAKVSAVVIILSLSAQAFGVNFGFLGSGICKYSTVSQSVSQSVRQTDLID